MSTQKCAKYYLNQSSEFVIDNYNIAKPFANFFPGIAGKYGIPMWVFYVNRGQAIISFGIKDKDHSILEFFPANKAWQLVSSQGFRTFIKFSGRKKIFYEPFQNGLMNQGQEITNCMRISSHGLVLEETNLSLGLKTEVRYFNIPQDSYAGLARIVSLKNLSRSPKKIQLLDGLPQIVPYGVSNLFLKKLGRTVEAWMSVKNLDKGVPFFKLDVDPMDRPEVIHIEEGNFYLAFHNDNKKLKIIKPIVDPQAIFGPVMDFSLPQIFSSAQDFEYPKRQILNSKTPCGFLYLDFELPVSGEKTFYSVTGYAQSRQALNDCVKRITHRGYIFQKEGENKKLIENLQQDIFTKSSSGEFDQYVRQTYLDNIIRGGYPIIFKSGAVFYLYSRKHGDLERDYNKFHIEPSYFSQGNGNYRDMNQNRRSDNWFNPEIGDFNLLSFFNLIQADGFNPLVIKGTGFLLKPDADLKIILEGKVPEKEISKLSGFLTKPFSPGSLFRFIEENKIGLIASYDELLDILISHSCSVQEAEHGEGFWTDHWTYNLDLLERYLGIFPEKFREIVFDRKAFTFFDNSEIVKPRREKYILKDKKVIQYHCVASDSAKKEMIKKRPNQPHTVRTQYGQGQIYQTTLINKLFCLLSNKLASLDPFGCGIEMEANKPNWFDALNGLPALFGSSLCETLELKRLIIIVKQALGSKGQERIPITEEIYEFLSGLDNLAGQYLKSDSQDKDFVFWDKSHALKEDYWKKTKFGFSGNEPLINCGDLKSFLERALVKIDLGINKARGKKRNIYYSYFINQVEKYEITKDNFIKPLEFSQKKLPLFLEGQMHALRLTKNKVEALGLYRATKSSELFDRQLKMYKVTASLSSQPEEIGRCRVFSPGWLENESIWLHMEYKYLLEILKQGMHKEFYEDFKNTVIAFQDPKRYGRSISENSSFLVSSVFTDKNLRGNGFVARLSGSTAEFLQIWLIMNIGKNPFFLNDAGELNLKLEPALAGWLFAKDKTYSFNFLGKIRVIYHNPESKDTFGNKAVQPREITFKDKDAKPVRITSGIIPTPYASQIRARQIKRIDIFLG